jgi:hypothetical protein
MEEIACEARNTEYVVDVAEEYSAGEAGAKWRVSRRLATERFAKPVKIPDRLFPRLSEKPENFALQRTIAIMVGKVKSGAQNSV